MSWSKRLSRGLAALCFTMTGFAAEASYSSVYFFGDSLSDTGNVYTATGGTYPPAPYYNGRFSDGPVWTEKVAAGLGLATDSKAWLQGGNNYAWGGALSGTDGHAGANTGLLAQVFGQWSSTTGGVADPNALYVIGIGSNDLLDAVSANSGSTAADVAFRHLAANTVLNNLTTSLGYLINSGAHNFLIANITDLGLTPRMNLSGKGGAATEVSAYYDALLDTALDNLRKVFAVNVAELDLFGMLTDVVGDTLSGGQRFGLSNALYPCFVPGTPACSESVFADDIHPTQIVQTRAGVLALAALGIPEPGTVALLGVGLVLLVATQRNGRRAVL
ncbi:SGNH/GDSL hydrolase family protein [Zoogloea sp. LCSB751]|uniref:SGNH/GDSL hydrolase family protein n=1 Tax=Zoogloea sp. LCSB751 TaxID=1965277 RepID=UPI0013747F8D|nr:SGNH/GDSL hydrolase family protein [Zoogloea sp. LCSB751]